MATYPRSLTQASTRPIYTDDARFIDGPLLQKAYWIWKSNTATDLTEQRAFRITYPYPLFQNGTPIQPSQATIYAAADDYFAMYVDGALVRPADSGQNSSKLLGFDVPLPIVSDGHGTEVQQKGFTLGFRVVNRNEFAGLLVGAIVQWGDGFIGKTEDPTFFTGTDEDPNVVGTWYGERLFEEGWEQPGGLKRSDDVRWNPAAVIPDSVRPRKRSRWTDEILDNSIKVFERLDSSSSTSTITGAQSSSTSLGVQCQSSNQVNLSSGKLAGVLAGSLVAMALLASLSSWLITRRHSSRSKKR